MVLGFGKKSDEAIKVLDEQRRMMRLYTAWKTRRDVSRDINSAFTGRGLKGLVSNRLASRYAAGVYDALCIDSGIATSDRLIKDVTIKAVTEWADGSTWSMTQQTTQVADPATNDGTAPPIEDAPPPAAKRIQSVPFENHLKQADYDTLINHACRERALHGTVALTSEVVYNPRTGLRKLTHRLLTPEHFDLEPNPKDPTDFVAFTRYWIDEEDGKTQCKRVMTLDEWVEYRLEPVDNLRILSPSQSDEGTMAWTETDRGTHKIGRIPVVIMHFDRPTMELWGSGWGKMLADMTIEANCSQTLVNYWQSLQIKVLGGDWDTLLPGQNWAYGNAIQFGKGGPTNVLDMSLDMARFLAVYVAGPRQRACATCGLSPNEFDLMLNQASGASLIMQYANRDRMAKARRPSARDAAIDLYNLDICVLYHALDEVETEGEYKGECIPIEGYEGTWPRGAWGKDGVWVPAPFVQAVHAPAAKVLPPYDPGLPWQQQSYRLVVDVIEPKYPQLASERKVEEDDNLEKGLTTLPEIYRERIDPDVSEADAPGRVTANFKTNAMMKRAMLGPTLAGDFLKPRAGPTNAQAGMQADAQQVATTLASNALMSNDTKDLAAAGKDLAALQKSGAPPAPMKGK